MDPFLIIPQERARFLEQFNALKPVGGIVTGEQAKGFFLQSQLPLPILGAIWALADTDADGKMNIIEFSIACKLINLKLRGFEIPKALPPSLQQLVQQAPMAAVAPNVPTANLLQSSSIPPLKPPVPPVPTVPIGAPGVVPPTVHHSVPLVPGIPPISPVPAVAKVPPVIPPAPAVVQQPRSVISPPSGSNTPNIMSPPLSSVQPTMPLSGIQPAASTQLAGLGQVMAPQQVITAQPLLGMSTTIPPLIQATPLTSIAITTQPATISMTQPLVATTAAAPTVPTVPVSAPSGPALERMGSIESPLGASSQLVEWAVPHASKLKYTQLFNTTDRTRSGFLSGLQARNIMVASQLPQQVLAQIWGLSDMDSDGRLSCEEFVLAMHLCDLARSGEKIPVPLPPDLIPPTLRRQRHNSLTATSTEQGDPLAGISSVTFEDKRKENFEKGQAELDRRRKALLEIQRKEQEERDRKEREEQEKREKIRLEQEKRRQQELEKQLQKQREVEQEREEQRRRAQEQREAARREMERQRQLEWEKQRSLELQSQRQREQENVLKMKAKNQNLSIELSQLNEKVKELSTKIGETRTGVTGVKATIDGMRTTRDNQLSQMSSLKSKLKENNARLVAISQEKAKLEAKNKLNMAADAAGQEQAKVAFSNKQITLKQLRDKLQDMENQIEVKMEDIENNNTQLDDLKKQLSTLIRECEELYVVYNEKRNKVLEMKGGKGREISTGWGDSAWDAAPAAWPQENDIETVDQGYTKYRALYEFVARNGDELSFQPGDIILVPVAQSAEPGWLAGELRGQTGWFPEAYVQPLDSTVSNAVFSEETVHNKTQLEEIAEVPENVSDNGSAVVEVAGEIPPAVPTMPSLVLGLGTPVEMNVVALYTFSGTSLGQLPFNKGDIIRVTENQDIWWYGELHGAEGWFPKTYVKLAADTITNVNNTQAVITDDGTLPPGEQEYYVAVYPYQSVEAGDLSFNQGEVVLVTKKEGDWWTGVIADRSGIFPSNYVQKADTQPVVSPVIEEPVVAVVAEQQKAVTPTAQLEAVQAAEARAVTPDFTTLTSQFDTSSGGEDSDSKNQFLGETSGYSSNGVSDNKMRCSPESHKDLNNHGSKAKKPEIATVIAPYQATSNEQLSLQRGQLIMIRKKTTTGWWEGELQAKGKKRQIGWFPASYVKLLGGGGGASSAKSTTAAAPATKTSAATTPDSTIEKVIALYQYKALNEDELSFEKDDVITLVSKDEPAWWRGELNGQTGLFPSNYVAAVSGSFKRKIKLSKEEKKRQQHIKELIITEQAYIDDMSVVHDVFEKPLLESRMLTPEEINKIFVNWRDIIVCNYIFLRSLRVRREMSDDGVIRMIGDILCENLPRMTVYVRFCSCQLNAATFLQKKTEESAEFRAITKKCQMDPRTKGMPLSSFLIKPMQRITKYPLLIQKILEYTPLDHPDRLYLEEALAKAEEFCSQVNEGVREKENSDRLEWLQIHVVCEGLSEPLIFNSLTNSVGQRKFLHYGVLTKTKSGKELVGFLMNDLLLLAQPNRPLGGQFSFDRNENCVLRLYKEPLLLSDVIIHSTTDNSLDTAEFKLEHNKIIYSLTAATHNEKVLWLKKLKEAQEVVLHSDKCKLQRQQSKQAQFGACGRILVVVLEGNRLKPPAVGGKRELFCEVSMGSQEHRTPPFVTTSTVTKWNASMQFLVKDLTEDVLCVTVFDKGHFAPDEFLGRTEVRVSDILKSTQKLHGPIIKILPLHEVESGDVSLKLDLRLFTNN